MKAHRIAVIAGDGIGNEVMPEGLRVVEAAARRFGIPLEFTTFDWAHCGYYQKHGQMMPADWREQLSGSDAIYFGAVGLPKQVPDHISLHGLLIDIRIGFDQYVQDGALLRFFGQPSKFGTTPIFCATVMWGKRPTCWIT